MEGNYKRSLEGSTDDPFLKPSAKVWLSSLAGRSKSPSMASEPGGYRGLLVDWGGVLTTSPFDSFARLLRSEGSSRETVARALRGDRRCRELLIGLETGRLRRRRVRVAAWRRSWASSAGPDSADVRGLRDPIRHGHGGQGRAPGGVRTGLVSNSWGTQRYDRALLEELFDAVVISGEVGIRKPAPEIYALAAERIGVEPRGMRVRGRPRLQSRSGRRARDGDRPPRPRRADGRASSSDCSRWTCATRLAEWQPRSNRAGGVHPPVVVVAPTPLPARSTRSPVDRAGGRWRPWEAPRSRRPRPSRPSPGRRPCACRLATGPNRP